MQKKKKIYTEAYVSYYIDLQVATSHLHTGTSFYRLTGTYWQDTVFIYWHIDHHILCQVPGTGTRYQVPDARNMVSAYRRYLVPGTRYR